MVRMSWSHEGSARGARQPVSEGRDDGGRRRTASRSVSGMMRRWPQSWLQEPHISGRRLGDGSPPLLTPPCVNRPVGREDRAELRVGEVLREGQTDLPQREEEQPQPPGAAVSNHRLVLPYRPVGAVPLSVTSHSALTGGGPQELLLLQLTWKSLGSSVNTCTHTLGTCTGTMIQYSPSRACTISRAR